MIDAATGEVRQIDVPPRGTDSPFAVILSSRNRFYSHFGSVFMEFDPVSAGFTHAGQTGDRVAMSMTEDPNGRIWAATYPKSHLISYDPETRELVDSGPLNQENWPQYPRSVAAGRDGWVYMGIGNTRSHIIAYHPSTHRVVPIATAEERLPGAGSVLTAADGTGYGRPNPKGPWFELRDGSRVAEVAKAPPAAPIRADRKSVV